MTRAPRKPRGAHSPKFRGAPVGCDLNLEPEAPAQDETMIERFFN